MHKLDLSSFSQGVSFSELRPYLKSLYPLNFFTVMIGVILTVAFMFILVVPVFSHTSTLEGTLLLVVGVVTVAIVALYSYRKAVNQAKIARMAVNNGLVASFNVPYPDYNGLYFQHGDDRQLLELVEMPGDGSLIGTYQYVTGSGRSRQTHTLCFARTTLSRKLPHIVLDNVKNNFWKFTNLPTVFSSDQKLSLEGDFNNTFTLYAPKEYESDALYIFTPDVMQAFMDSGYQIDAEIVDNYLYIYYDGQTTLADAQFLESLHIIIQTTGREVEQQSDHYADERVLSKTANIVALPGKRLKSGYGGLVIIVIMLYTFLQIIRTESGNELIVSGSVFLTLIALVVFAVIGRRGRS